MDAGKRFTIAFLIAAVFGSMVGAFLIIGPELRDGMEAVPFVLLFTGIITLFSLPYVGIGLLLAGLPLAWILRDVVTRLWMAPVFALCGWAVGSLIYRCTTTQPSAGPTRWRN